VVGVGSQDVVEVSQPSGTGALERWLRVSAPADRIAWRTTLEKGAAAGAAGVLVPMGPRLLDELRRPQERTTGATCS